MRVGTKIGLALILIVIMVMLSVVFFSPALYKAKSHHPDAGKVSPESTSVVDKIASNLEAGNIAFNTPGKMMLGQSADIELLLSPKESIEKLQEMIVAEGKVEGYEIIISNEMEAQLTGSAFKINPLLSERQLVGSEKVTKWKWQIEPTKAGTHQLHLTLSAILYVHGSPKLYVIRTFDHDITIEVTLTGWLSNFVTANWQWLWTAILVPVASWLLLKKRKKSKKSASQ